MSKRSNLARMIARLRGTEQPPFALPFLLATAALTLPTIAIVVAVLVRGGGL